MYIILRNGQPTGQEFDTKADADSVANLENQGSDSSTFTVEHTAKDRFAIGRVTASVYYVRHLETGAAGQYGEDGRHVAGKHFLEPVTAANLIEAWKM